MLQATVINLKIYRFKSLGCCCRVDWQISDVSENRNSLIFRVKQSKNLDSEPEDKGSTRLRRPSNYLPVDMA